MSETPAQHKVWRRIYFVLLVISSAALAFFALIIPFLSDTFSSAPKEGQVAERDYRAPQAINYVSEILTEQKRQAAEGLVTSVYTPLDTRVARQQLESLQTVLAFITSVRADAYATSQQKTGDLAAMTDIRLSQDAVTTILGLTDSRWQTVQQEAIMVLEKLMSSQIRPETVEDIRQRAPALVSLSLPESQAAVVAELAAGFIAPNSQYSDSLTQVARQKARQEIEPVLRSFAAGETIVPRGRVIQPEDMEALQKMGLFVSQQNWSDLVSATALVGLAVAFLLLYLRREKLALAREARSMGVAAMLFLTFLYGARLMIPGHTVVPYAFPLAAYSLTVAALFGAPFGLVTSLPLAILVGYGLPNALDLTLYCMMSCLFGVLALGRARRMSSYFWAGTTIAISGSVVVLIYRLPMPTTDANGLATLVGAALFNGLASASTTILLQFILAQFLGMISPMQLVDLTRPDHPLLRQLLREAPGTYQHSLQVANLAEQAAELIGADPLMTRVGALYHDIGKVQNPIFFIENQLPGFQNPHDSLAPAESAAIIICHVTDGLELGRKHRLPRRILEFIAQHHGTTITRYQYARAIKEANGGQVDMEQFRYPGPRPQSRETAILMLADGCEARVRSDRPTNEDELRHLIKEVINERASSGQLDDTKLTLHDLNVILESFTSALRGIYHPRVQYPKIESSLSPDTVPVAKTPQIPAELPIDAAPISTDKYR